MGNKAKSRAVCLVLVFVGLTSTISGCRDEEHYFLGQIPNIRTVKENLEIVEGCMEIFGQKSEFKISGRDLWDYQ